jgi:ATP-dependent protease ClpP protease subunit
MKTPVYTYIDGFAASAATMISVAGKKRFMTENSIMLVHQLSSATSGKFEEMKDEYNNLLGLMDIIKKIYLSNSKISKENLDNLLKQDLWLDSTKSIQLGFVDKILK